MRSTRGVARLGCLSCMLSMASGFVSTPLPQSKELRCPAGVERHQQHQQPQQQALGAMAHLRPRRAATASSRGGTRPFRMVRLNLAVRSAHGIPFSFVKRNGIHSKAPGCFGLTVKMSLGTAVGASAHDTAAVTRTAVPHAVQEYSRTAAEREIT